MWILAVKERAGALVITRNKQRDEEIERQRWKKRGIKKKGREGD